MDHHEHNCCHHEGDTKNNTSLVAAAYATFHCLTGCVIGELIGLMIGVSAGMHPYAIMALATTLAYLTGFTFTIFPLMRRTGLDFKAAFKAVWIGEFVSIAVMEFAMNTVDYHMGGMRAGSVMTLQFWQAMGLAVIAGYIAAFPVNYWLIGRQLKKCH